MNQPLINPQFITSGVSLGFVGFNTFVREHPQITMSLGFVGIITFEREHPPVSILGLIHIGSNEK